MKNKLIEELAKTIRNTLYSMQWYEINFYTIAEACYKLLLHMGNDKYFNNLGYYKIPEGSVVLSKELQEQLVPLGRYKEVKALYDKKCAELKKSRKETAKEILQEVGKACCDYQWFKNLCKKFGVEVEE